MKNKLLATIAAFGLVGSASAIEINDNLSINGFIDGSYQYSNDDLSATTNNVGKDQALGADEVELNFITNVGNVDGVINIDSHNGLGGVEVEQAHITYSLDNGVSFQLGKYGSALGFEREDPTSLYTFSRAYEAGSGFNLGNIDEGTGNGPDVVEGLAVAYSNDAFSLRASFDNDLSTDAEEDDLNVELSIGYTGIENTTLGLGYYFDNRQNPNNAAEQDILNVHASTSLGKLFLAAEYTEIQNKGNTPDQDGYLVLADYDFNDKIGAAIRVSSNEKAASAGDYESITIAPNYAITDSLGAIIEYSDIEDAGNDINLLAIELLYTF
jgi:hypothetical protein